MVEILHRVGMKSASVDDVYAALTTLEGLSGWWATFLVSLKQLVETGTGAPEPYDQKVSNWH